jgi:folate-binding protein YgfZ
MAFPLPCPEAIPAPKAQVDAARNRALAVPRADLATLIVTGNDRISWLNGLLTCDLLKPQPSPAAAVYGLVVGRNGRVLADATAVFDEPGARLLLAVPRLAVEAVRKHLDHYLVMEDAEVAPDSEAFAVWAVHGPRSLAALDAARAAGALGGALDPTGLGGAILLVPRGVGTVADAALREHAVLGDASGWEALRLERAVPSFGADFDDKTYPQEAALEKVAVSFEKGCYLGQEVVCMLEMRGHVKRKLVPLVIESDAAAGTGSAPPRGAVVTDTEGAPVGEVTSAALSPTLGKPVALAMLKRAAAVPGERVMLGGSGASVVERPA